MERRLYRHTARRKLSLCLLLAGVGFSLSQASVSTDYQREIQGEADLAPYRLEIQGTSDLTESMVLASLGADFEGSGFEWPSGYATGPNNQVAIGAGGAGNRNNRLWYVGIQTALSTWIYGPNIPVAYDVDNWRVHTAMPLLIAPIAFGSHFYFSRNREFRDAHLTGTTYLSLASLYTAYALPYTFLPSGSGRHRVSAITALALYPLGVWGGYMLGDLYADQPGRVSTQWRFASGFAALGALSPLLYFEKPFSDKNGEITRRLMLGQSLVMGTAGHFLAGYYRPGEEIPGGVGTGILHHTLLGSLLGLQIAALSDAKTSRPWIGAALAGGTLGFAEGLWYFQDSYDTQERAVYNSLGMLGGALMGTGIIILVANDKMSDYAQKVTYFSLITGGTWAGYWLTNLLTQDLVERRANLSEEEAIRRVTLNLVPSLEAENRPDGISYRYRISGLTIGFR